MMGMFDIGSTASLLAWVAGRTYAVSDVLETHLGIHRGACGRVYAGIQAKNTAGFWWVHFCCLGFRIVSRVPHKYARELALAARHEAAPQPVSRTKKGSTNSFPKQWGPNTDPKILSSLFWDTQTVTII